MDALDEIRTKNAMLERVDPESLLEKIYGSSVGVGPSGELPLSKTELEDLQVDFITLTLARMLKMTVYQNYFLQTPLENTLSELKRKRGRNRSLPPSRKKHKKEYPALYL